MPEFMMLMKGTTPTDGWERYIDTLVQSGLFRGGSAFGNSSGVSKVDNNNACVVTGYMRFEADSLADIHALLPGNPVYEAGDPVEIHELVTS